MTDQQRAEDGTPTAPHKGDIYRFLIEYSNDIVSLLDPTGTILYTSPSVTRSLGYSPEELLHRNAFDLVHPEDLPPVLEAFQRSFQTGSGYVESFRFRHRSGHWVYLEASGRAVQDEMGRASGVVAIVRDISERMRLERKAEEARLAAERAAERVLHLQALTEAALVHLTLDQMLQEMLTRIRRMLSVDTTAIMLLEDDRLVARAAVGLEEEVRRRISVGTGEGFAGRIAQTREGAIIEECREADIASAVLRASGIRSLMGVPLLVEGRLLGVLHVGSFVPRSFDAQDLHLLQIIGDRVALAIERSRAYESEREARRTAEDTARLLQQAVEAKDEFLGIISHELRTPLTQLYGGIQLLSRGFAEIPETERSGLLEDLAQNADRLRHLLEDLLALARAELGEMPEPQPVLVPRIAERQAQEMGRHGSRTVLVRMKGAERPVRAIPGYVEQIVRNLLDNASKYSPPDKPVIVEAKAEAEGLRVSVLDNGPGVPEEELDRIFERFYRAAGTRTAEGVGIGLAVCKRLVAIQAGRIWAANRPRGGLAVTFTLPWWDDSAARA